MMPSPRRQVCGILFPHDTPLVRDPHGCVQASAHDGPHQFMHEGQAWAWENDATCNCLDCQSEDSCD